MTVALMKGMQAAAGKQGQATKKLLLLLLLLGSAP
jgi:hypothetical protein